jgi:hypothetical protein
MKLTQEEYLAGKNEIEMNEEPITPLCMYDILTVCKEYHRLGWNMQHQIEAIIEYGVEQAIDERMVDVAALPHIKHFLKGIASNFYFGDAQLQASEVVKLIKHFERTRPNIRPGN